MNTTAAGSVLVGQQAALRELYSARPDAPVVPAEAPQPRPPPRLTPRHALACRPAAPWLPQEPAADSAMVVA